MKTIKNSNLIIAVVMFLCTMLAGNALAQEQGFRWGKWSKGHDYSGGGGMPDEIIDSYVDSAGNTYIFGVCGKDAHLGTYLVENGPYICPMDTVSGYVVGNVRGNYLAKIDSTGTILWCKCVRGATSNHLTTSWNMVVKGDRITIAFDAKFNGNPYISTPDPTCWLYFFDTLITASCDHFYKNEWVTYFVTFDLDGNRIDVHDMRLWANRSSPVFTTCRLAGHGDARFGIDNEGNIHIFSCTTGDVLSDDSTQRAYIIVDGDTNRKYPLNIRTQDDHYCFPNVYYRMSSDWHLQDLHYMIDTVVGWHPREWYSLATLSLGSVVADGDDLYINGYFECKEDAPYIAQSMTDTSTFLAIIYLDSIHYLKAENIRDFYFMPFLLKLNKNGDIVWIQQLYTESPNDFTTNYFSTKHDGLAIDEDNVYTQYWVIDYYTAPTRDSSRCATFYLDSAHATKLTTNRSSPHIVIVNYNKNSGIPVDYYYVDSTAKSTTSQSLAILGDEMILNVGFFYLDYASKPTALHKSELCRINKYTKEVDRSTPITYTSLIKSRGISINSNGWVFKSEIGETPRLFDSIPIGPTAECSVMTFYYDSTLDTRPRPCPEVDSLWGNVSQHTAILQWSSAFSHAVYELAYIPDGDDWDNATLLEVSDTTASITLPDDPGMGSYQCYQFRVRGRCDGRRVASSPWSEPISLCVEVVVEGIDDVENNSGIALSPNPTTGRVSIQGLTETPLYITLFDLSGRPLETYRHTTAFDISHLPQGSYLAELHLPNGQVHRLKLIKK